MSTPIGKTVGLHEGVSDFSKDGNCIRAEYADILPKAAPATNKLDIVAGLGGAAAGNEIGAYIMDGKTKPTIDATKMTPEQKTALTDYLSAQLDDTLSVPVTPAKAQDAKLARIMEMAEKGGVKKDVLANMRADLEADTAPAPKEHAALAWVRKQQANVQTTNSKDPVGNVLGSIDVNASPLPAATPAATPAPVALTPDVSGVIRPDGAAATNNWTQNKTPDSEHVDRMAAYAESLIAALKAQPTDAPAKTQLTNLLGVLNGFGPEMQQAVATKLQADGMLDDFKACADAVKKGQKPLSAVFKGDANSNTFYEKIGVAHTALAGGNQDSAAKEALSDLFGDGAGSAATKGQFMADWASSLSSGENKKAAYRKAYVTANDIDKDTGNQQPCCTALDKAFESNNEAAKAKKEVGTDTTFTAAPVSTPVAATPADARRTDPASMTQDVPTFVPVEDLTGTAKNVATALDNPDNYNTTKERVTLAERIKALKPAEQDAIARHMVDVAIDNPKATANLKVLSDSLIGDSRVSDSFFQSIKDQFNTRRKATTDATEKRNIDKIRTQFVSAQLAVLPGNDTLATAMGTGLTNLLSFLSGGTTPPMLAVTQDWNKDKNTDTTLPTTQAWAKALGVTGDVTVKIEDGGTLGVDSITYSGLDKNNKPITSSFALDKGTYDADQLKAMKVFVNNQTSVEPTTDDRFVAKYSLPSAGMVLNLDVTF